MIDKYQLRHGNIVMDRGGKLLVIDYFEGDKVCHKNTFVFGSNIMEAHPLTEYFSQLQPVPLTHDLLMRLGFEKIIFEYKKGRVNWCNNCARTSDYYMPCEFLHELQNIFYYAHNQELPVSKEIVK